MYHHFLRENFTPLFCLKFFLLYFLHNRTCRTYTQQAFMHWDGHWLSGGKEELTEEEQLCYFTGDSMALNSACGSV